MSANRCPTHDASLQLLPFQPATGPFCVRHIPKRKDEALSFRADVIEGNIGWGLHFVERLNSSLAITVMFVVSLIFGVGFAVYWSIWKKDIQGAFGVASYVESVVTLGVMAWQVWSVWRVGNIRRAEKARLSAHI